MKTTTKSATPRLRDPRGHLPARAAGAVLPFLTALLLAGLPVSGAAQVRVGPGDGCPDPERGSLGITGFRCDHCSFSRSRSGFTSAEFLTEPEVYGVRPDATGGDDLEVGDVLVALDGDLITTEAGARRLTTLPSDTWVDVTIRRDGRTRELRIRTGRACDVRGPAPEPLQGPPELGPPTPLPPGAAAAEPMPGAAPPLPEPGARTALPAEEPPASPSPGSLARLPAPPSPSALAPGATLGFGIECGRCSYRTRGEGDPGSWSFARPPRVYQVREGGPAWSAGLRSGDVLEAIDGVLLTTPEGGRRFARLTPGRAVRWTVLRGGRRLEVVTVPETPSASAEAEGATPGDGMPLRYTGSVGDAEVEVRGGTVNVREDREGGVLVIRTGDVVVIVRRAGLDGASRGSGGR